MTDSILAMAAFGGVCGLVVLIFLLVGSRTPQVDRRLAEVSRSAPPRANPWQAALTLLSGLGAKLMPEKKEKSDLVRTRLLQAGLYRRHASAVFAALRFLLLVLPVSVGVGLGLAGMMSMTHGIQYGIFIGLAATIAPGFWIKRLKAGRQRQIRRALPDALDVIVICLEGGLSMPAAFACVAEELSGAYPLLAGEMNIVRKRIDLGQSTSAAFRELSERFDVDELRSLALFIGQAETYGTSLVQTLGIQADGMRLKRYQWAETQAQKAPVKMIFPTVLCIFPAFYIVMMAPAGVQIYHMFKTFGS